MVPASRPRFRPDEVLLLGPGPSPVGESVRAAMGAPLLGHLDPAFLKLMDQVQGDLRWAFGTEHPFTLPVSGTGSAGMECCVANLVAPGDRVVVGVHGVFGGRMAEAARRQGADVVEVRAPFGEALDPAAMAEAIAAGDTDIVAVVHAETSTGVLQPLAEIAAAVRDSGALFAVDCVTSLGGAPVEVDALGVDAAFAGTQKCLSAPPGLAPVTFSERARDKAAARVGAIPSWYFDVNLLGAYWGGERAYHHTAPISMIYALAESLAGLRDEGLERCWERHRDAAAALYAGLEALALRCLVAPGLRTPMLTSVGIPDGIDDLAVRRRLRQVHGIEIGGGLGTLAGVVWRVGLMGGGAHRSAVLRLVTALAECLGAEGRSVDGTAAVEAVRGAPPVASPRR